MKNRAQATDVLYFEASGDVVASLRSWSAQQALVSETSKTFSGQFFDACRAQGLRGHVISFNRRADHVSDGALRATNTPRLAIDGVLPFHLCMVLRSVYIVWLVMRYRPQYLIVNSGVANWLALAPAKLFGTRIIASLHNALWPEGFYPRKPLAKLLLGLDARFFKSVADAVLGVSETCLRQVVALSARNCLQLFRHVPQFAEADFPPRPTRRPHAERPFTLVFAGRIESDKGVFDILQMAESLRQRGYTDFRFVLCGQGSAFNALQQDIAEKNLASCVELKGRLDRQDLLDTYRSAHVGIVPTRSEFAEGFAMVVLEAVLLGRPVITNAVVPAYEEVAEAALLAETDNPESYAEQIAALMDSPALYDRLCSRCDSIRDHYFSADQGLDRALIHIFQIGRQAGIQC